MDALDWFLRAVRVTRLVVVTIVLLAPLALASLASADQAEVLRQHAIELRRQAATVEQQRKRAEADAHRMQRIDQRAPTAQTWSSPTRPPVQIQNQIKMLRVREESLLDAAGRLEQHADQLRPVVPPFDGPPENVVPYKGTIDTPFAAGSPDELGDGVPSPRDGASKSCFIATAAYGTPMADEVVALRAFRDRHLQSNPFGRWLVGQYYRLSPPVAALIERDESLKAMTRRVLAPVVFAVRRPGGFLSVLGGAALVIVGTGVWRRRRTCRAAPL